jgi:hypothetical protein
MRRYVILYRRGTGLWGKLTPVVHLKLYDRVEVHQAFNYLRENNAAEGIALRLGDEAFNICVTLEPKTPDTFEF